MSLLPTLNDLLPLALLLPALLVLAKLAWRLILPHEWWFYLSSKLAREGCP